MTALNKFYSVFTTLIKNMTGGKTFHPSLDGWRDGLKGA
jgi:hypothetical protein